MEVSLLPRAGQERPDKVPPVRGLDGGERGGGGGGIALRLADAGSERRALPPGTHVPRCQGPEVRHIKAAMRGKRGAAAVPAAAGPGPEVRGARVPLQDGGSVSPDDRSGGTVQ